jgi:hypothetical protein
MANSGVGGSISAASDAQISNPILDNILVVNGSNRWQNVPISGKAALAYNGGFETIASLTSTANTTLNLASGNIFNVTLNVATTTFAFSVSGASTTKACSFTVYIKQSAAGNNAIVWPASVMWSNATPPTHSTGSNAIDIVVFESINGGTTWFGSLVGTNFS